MNCIATGYTNLSRTMISRQIAWFATVSSICIPSSAFSIRPTNFDFGVGFGCDCTSAMLVRSTRPDPHPNSRALGKFYLPIKHPRISSQSRGSLVSCLGNSVHLAAQSIAYAVDLSSSVNAVPDAAPIATAVPLHAFGGRALLGGMLAGATAGAAVDLALYPLDTIKTRLQARAPIINNTAP